MAVDPNGHERIQVTGLLWQPIEKAWYGPVFRCEMPLRQVNKPGNRTVLILDDQENLLELTALYLRNHGHATMQCTSAQSAIARFNQAQGTVGLLIADVNLPDGSGVEIGVKLWESSPELKLLFVSGYPVEGWGREDATLFKQLPPESVRVLQKPFSGGDLLTTVTELIGAPLRVAPPLTRESNGR